MKRIARLFLKIAGILFVLLNIIVIFHAYKFTHFYDRPAGYESKKSAPGLKEIIFGVTAYKQAETAPDTAYETFTLTTKDSIKLEGWLLKVPNAIGTVALFHGHGSKKSAVLTEAFSFRQLGYSTLLLDMRAHGNSGGNVCTISYKEAEDVKLAYNYLQEKGEKNIILWGVSLGAATISKAIHDYALKPQKVIMEMSFGSLPEAVKGRVKMMHLPVQPLSALLTFWGGVEQGFWAFNIRPVEYVKQISCPVLLQWGRNDPRVSKAETDSLFSNIHSAKKLVIYENCGHESLCTKEHEKWVKEVSDFLDDTSR